MSVRVDSFASAILHRAALSVEAEGGQVVTMSHILEAVAGRPVVPILQRHLIESGELAESCSSPAISDLHLLAAIVRDRDSMGSQVLGFFCDLDALEGGLQTQLEAFDVAAQDEGDE